MTIPCTEPDCPCEGLPTLQRLYWRRAIMGLAVANGFPLADYDHLQQLIAQHEHAWCGTVAQREEEEHADH